MAIMTVVIPDGSVELEELDFIVAQIILTDPTMTREKWVRNQVQGYLSNRVLNIYKGHIKDLSIQELKNKFGSLSEVR